MKFSGFYWEFRSQASWQSLTYAYDFRKFSRTSLNVPSNIILVRIMHIYENHLKSSHKSSQFGLISCLALNPVKWAGSASGVAMKMCK